MNQCTLHPQQGGGTYTVHQLQNRDVCAGIGSIEEGVGNTQFSIISQQIKGPKGKLALSPVLNDSRVNGSPHGTMVPSSRAVESDGTGSPHFCCFGLKLGLIGLDCQPRELGPMSLSPSELLGLGRGCSHTGPSCRRP